MEKYEELIKSAAGKVRKGMIRATILRSIRKLSQISDNIDQAISIKSMEVEEFSEKDPGKVKILKNQIRIMESGRSHISEAIQKLSEYKNIATHRK